MQFGRPTRLAALVLAAVWACAAQPSGSTALDRYVRAPDDSYRYSLVKRIVGRKHTAFVLDLTSQTWAGPGKVDRAEWRHWLIVYRPEKVLHRTALLMISGGSNGDGPPEKSDKRLASIAETTHSIVAELKMVPNQPLSYEGDPFGPRTEDELIAYHWRKFLDGAPPRALTRMAMTKSAVRAMDAISDFLADKGAPVRNFFVMGGSKRGWTTWTTAAVDSRVIGISPIVIDLLNLRPSFLHHYRAYGFWAPAAGDYYREGVMDRLDEPRYDEMLDIVAPFAYRERCTMPKFILNAAGDQFFLPDSSQFYFDRLPGEKHLRYVPNADHSLRKTDAWESLTAFYHAVLNGIPRPEYSWEFLSDGAIRVETRTPPSAVKLWQATNPRRRDFRLESAGPIYRGEELAPTGDGVYIARVAAPPEGWTAFFVELTFPSGVKHPFKFTSGVRVTPDTYPFAEPVAGETKLGPEVR